ncbi:MAG: hypothetical protein ACLTW9_23525 [Enterocloster sp.]
MTLYSLIYIWEDHRYGGSPLVYERDKDCRLVFFSSSADYAVDSYRSKGRLYYLMKPLSYEDLALALGLLYQRASGGGTGTYGDGEGGGVEEAVVPFSKLRCTWTALNVWCGYTPKRYRTGSCGVLYGCVRAADAGFQIPFAATVGFT